MKKYEHLNLVEDIKGKTTSFYLQDPYKKVDKSAINFLKEYSKNNDNCDVRVCIHASEKSLHHDMILLQNRSNYYTPHKHLKVGDTFYLIEGKLGCFLYEDDGCIRYSCVLNEGEIFKTPKNVFHNIMPITKTVIYHEAKTGPFIREHTKVPEWCPSLDEDPETIEKYKKLLLSNISDEG